MTEDLDFDPEELAMLRALFRTEAHESLESVTARLLAGGSALPTADALTEMMRVTHTLKGAAGTVGLGAIVDLSHRLESVFAAFAGAPASWTGETADELVEICDGIRGYLDHMTQMSDAAQSLAAQDLRDQIARIARPGRTRFTRPISVVEEPDLDRERVTGVHEAITGVHAVVPDPLEPPSRDSAAEITREVSFMKPLDLRRDWGRESSPDLPVLELSAQLGEAIPTVIASDAIVDEPSGRVDRYGAPDVADHDEPAAEPKSWLRVEPARIDDLMSSAGELLFDRTRIERRVQLLRTLSRDLARTRQDLHDALDVIPPSRPVLVEAEAQLAGQAALLAQTTAALLDEIEALRRTVGGLQRGLTRIRMESARKLMNHAARTLRALRRATGARVELRTVGEDTEFDKAVAEQLVDPVTQLLRNAVAHGVEPPAERIARGKPATATVTLRARQDGNLLLLEVHDDGRGVDTAALRERLVETGRWSAPRAQLASEADILDALLDTGVSIRGDADELAGRGIGVGLVRQTVAKLGGEVAVTSQPGKGTTFTLRLPLSTALAQAMLFKVGGQVYAVPNVHVIDTTIVEAGATMAAVRPRLATTDEDERVPVLRLEALLGHGAATDRRPAVVVSFAGKTLVCTVDKLVGPREIIIKPLGPLLAPLTLYAGATISGSGKVQLILDPAQLVRRAYPDSLPATVSDAASAPLVLAGRALVVDDSRAIREAMTSMLGREGWIVDVAEDGARALQMAKQLRYDLIVTDLEMPELGGFELIARLRKDERFKATPVVIITSRAQPEHRRKARELGVRALVAKPVTRRKLLEALAVK
ncbi:MAG TPA: response regulator [Kofleriaceae bacterium]|jgi:chemotaxis protein histidine kinase CheA